MKRLSIIGTAGIPANYGGFETLIEHISKTLSEHFEVTVFCSVKNYEKKMTHYNDVKLSYINLSANGISSILYDSISMIKSIRNSDVVLVLGVSGAICLPILRLFNKKIVTNIDGIEWKRKKWNIFIRYILKFFEYVAVKSSHIVVGDNKAITDYIFEKYKMKSELISYGGDHIKKIPIENEDLSNYPFLNDKYSFTVCRIEPENNIHIILSAISKSNISYVCIGNWNSNNYGKILRKKFSEYSNIYLLDPIYEIDQLDKIRSNSYLYLHGHSAGGTNPSLVEAMNLGLPIYAFDCNFNRNTTHSKCNYFKDVDELKNSLDNIKEQELIKIGNDMLDIAEKKYKWSIISDKYTSVIMSLIDDV